MGWWFKTRNTKTKVFSQSNTKCKPREHNNLEGKNAHSTIQHAQQGRDGGGGEKKKELQKQRAWLLSGRWE